jgi:hypothetical protein
MKTLREELIDYLFDFSNNSSTSDDGRTYGMAVNFSCDY